ncbi:MAG TPA: alpha/beta hydrolase [Alphaproteobacteria bacterium]|jgi:alpha/beta superfamily hydrolase|nr:alpha/beta hydrolase [Alphaproteobacteria bacterium]HIK87912.1 alpha/beta hydrolase [Alphaproteobacteria bacterium]
MPEIVIPGPEGRLEAIYNKGSETTSPLCLVLHPHPRQGGTMNNKLVYNTYQAFKKSNFSTLRFNFRGVGKSLGTYDNGVGELTDAAAALDWLQTENPAARATWIAGFSFGAWLALQLLMRRPEISGFVAISPPASLYDFAFLAPCPASGLIIQGSEDKIVEEESVRELVEKLNKQNNINVDYKKIIGADHFFAKNLDDIQKKIKKYIDKNT